MGLKTLRLKRGLTQRELAKKANVPYSRIAATETNARPIGAMSLDVAIRLCDALRVSNPRKLLEPDDSGEKPTDL